MNVNSCELMLTVPMHMLAVRMLALINNSECPDAISSRRGLTTHNRHISTEELATLTQRSMAPHLIGYRSREQQKLSGQIVPGGRGPGRQVPQQENPLQQPPGQQLSPPQQPGPIGHNVAGRRSSSMQRRPQHALPAGQQSSGAGTAAADASIKSGTIDERCFMHVRYRRV